MYGQHAWTDVQFHQKIGNKKQTQEIKKVIIG